VPVGVPEELELDELELLLDELEELLDDELLDEELELLLEELELLEVEEVEVPLEPPVIDPAEAVRMTRSSLDPSSRRSILSK
jgi:hypothetical protein